MRENMISVIIPVYSTGSKLKFTINSIIQQTYRNWELLLIDDGSTDAKTIDICRKSEKNDSRIKVFSKKNEGIEKTRLFGIEKASGDFLILLLLFCSLIGSYIINLFYNKLQTYI